MDRTAHLEAENKRLRSAVSSYRRRAVELEEENERLRADQRRLEWLIKTQSHIAGNFVNVHTHLPYRPDWRDAIDEVMSNALAGGEGP